MVFAREAYTHVPLTLDHGTFLRMLAELRLGIIDGKGTAIGNGLGVALNRLRKSDARSKVVILLTDGDNNAGNISPEQAARYRADAGGEGLHHPRGRQRRSRRRADAGRGAPALPGEPEAARGDRHR